MFDDSYVFSDWANDETSVACESDMTTIEAICAQDDPFWHLTNAALSAPVPDMGASTNQLLTALYDAHSVDEFSDCGGSENLVHSTELEGFWAEHLSPATADSQFGMEYLQLAYSEHSEGNESDLTSARSPWPLSSDSAISLPLLISKSPARHTHRPSCRECQRQFENEYLLEDHARRLNHRSYVCAEPGCFKSYCRRDVLRRHVTTHTYSEISCPFCSKSNRKRIFKRKDNLNQHIRTRHPEFYDKFKAALCGSHQRKTPNVDECSEQSSSTGAEDSVEFGYSTPQPFLSPVDSKERKIEETAHSSNIVRDVARALRIILGDENHVAVQMIEQRLGVCSDTTTEKLALSLAHLALAEPKDLPIEAKNQLRRTCGS